jgi:hypothetical protein
MTTTGPADGDRGGSTAPLTDVRTVVIAVLATVLSFGAGASVGVVVAASVGMTLGVLAGISSSGAAAVLLIQALHQLIR